MALRKLDFRDPWLAIARVSKSTSLGYALWLLCRIRTPSLHSPGLCKRSNYGMAYGMQMKLQQSDQKTPIRGTSKRYGTLQWLPFCVSKVILHELTFPPRCISNDDHLHMSIGVNSSAIYAIMHCFACQATTSHNINDHDIQRGDCSY